MLITKLNRINQLQATLDEVNEIKSQLLAELERISKIETSTMSEVSDLESEILSTTQVILTDKNKLADINIKDCYVTSLDNWKIFERYVNYAGILICQGIIYVSNKGELQVASELPGNSNSPIQKAVDNLNGYHQSRYNTDEKMPIGIYNLPELDPCVNLDTGKKSRKHWHGNHCRKQVWYSYRTNPDDWFYIDWENTSPEYWIALASEINSKPQEVKQQPIYNPISRGRGSYQGAAIRPVGDKFPDQDELIAKYHKAFSKTA